MEMSISCDNLLCDALGRAPSCRVVVYLRNRDRRLSNKDTKSEWLHDMRKSLKDSCKTESVKFSEIPAGTSNEQQKKFGSSRFYIQSPQEENDNQVGNPIWKLHSMTEIVEVGV